MEKDLKLNQRKCAECGATENLRWYGIDVLCNKCVKVVKKAQGKWKGK